MKKILFTYLLLVSGFSNAQNVDSLIAVAKKHPANDTEKVYIYNTIGRRLQMRGDMREAKRYLENSLQLSGSLHYKRGQSQAYKWLANVALELGDFPKALELQLKSVKISEEMRMGFDIASAYLTLGNIYFRTADYPKALENFRITLKIAFENKFEPIKATCYGDMGIIYNIWHKLDTAEDYYLRAIRYYEKLPPTDDLAAQYTNLGILKWDQKKYNEALYFLNKSLVIQNQFNNKINAAAALNNIGELYVEMNQYKKGISILLEALRVSKECRSRGRIMETYESLARCYRQTGNYEKAVENFEQYNALKDSMITSGNNKSMQEMRTRFETEKKEKEIELLQKDKNIRELELGAQEANLHKQRITIYSTLGSLGLLLFLVFFIWYSYRQKKKRNLDLERKSLEINRQKNSIEEKNILITDSIDYAFHIQQAILPPDEMIKKYFLQSFVLFLPKDVVSGDFYWLYPCVTSTGAETGDIYLSAVDCTGHGVPGALMSVMAYNLLDRIVGEGKQLQPSLILDELNKTVIETLQQKTKNVSVKYGMDISLVKFSTDRKSLEFSGAHNPLLHIREGKLTEVKANKSTIGMAREKFSNCALELKKGDMLYLFTDGYADQKGGPDNTKFFSGPFREMLVSLNGHTPEKQKNELTRRFNEWQNGGEQIDDVLIIGIRI